MFAGVLPWKNKASFMSLLNEHLSNVSYSSFYYNKKSFLEEDSSDDLLFQITHW